MSTKPSACWPNTGFTAHASEADMHNLLDTIIDVIVPVEVHYQWRPQLADAGDEMVLEAAVNGRAKCQSVTFNSKDYKDTPNRFGIELWQTGGSTKEDKAMTTRDRLFLRLPLSLKAAVERLAHADGTSMNQFPGDGRGRKAVPSSRPKLSLPRQRLRDLDVGFRFLTRPGGEPPRPGDELPDLSPSSAPDYRKRGCCPSSQVRSRLCRTR